MEAVARHCVTCQVAIDPERLEVLPHTTTCCKCSTEPKRLAFMTYEHKTAGYVQFIDPRNTEAVRQARRAYRRAR